MLRMRPRAELAAKYAYMCVALMAVDDQPALVDASGLPEAGLIPVGCC